MIENVGRKVFWIVVFLLTATLLLVLPEKPFRMGLDLQGGTRLVYRFDFEEAVLQGKLKDHELSDKDGLLRDFCAIIRERVDPDGVKEPSIRPEGSERVVIEIPGTANLGEVKASVSLSQDLPAAMLRTISIGAVAKASASLSQDLPAAILLTMDLGQVAEDELKLFPLTDGVIQIGDELILYEARAGRTLERLTRGHQGTEASHHKFGDEVQLRSDEAVREDELKLFPLTDGVIQIGDELIRYGARKGGTLEGLTRGHQGTAASDHKLGDKVQLRSVDPIRRAIENPGALAFYIASPTTGLNSETDLTFERTKVDAWIAANPNRTISHYNKLTSAEGGATEGLLWFPRRLEGGASGPLSERELLAVTQPSDENTFTGEDLKEVGVGQDQLAQPAVSFSMDDSRQAAFGDWTEAHKNQIMAVVLNDEVATAPVLKAGLHGGAIIEGGPGGFTVEEVTELVQVLRSGSLRIKPILEHEERVGATLGEEFVKTGALSAIVGLIAVLLFMMVYYRRLGVLAAVSLISNLVLLMGAMAFLKATLTLPGVAGIILTVGMAVDANILIFERIREEALRGRKPREAAKNGFERALITIVDANLTTLITAGILYKVGTGPVRGFATTLSVGIITSMFAALVLTRVLVHLQVERGVQSFNMMRLVHDTKVAFLNKAKIALSASLLLIIGGLYLFISLPAKEKLSIDFLGGTTLTARTEEPQQTEKIRELVGGITGIIGQSAEVKPILASSDGDNGYKKFRITYKGEGEKDTEVGTAGEVGGGLIKKALEGVLMGDAISISVTNGVVNGDILFDASHPMDDIKAALEPANLSDLKVSGGDGTYSFTAQAGPTDTPDTITALIGKLLLDQTDSAGNEMRLAVAIPETTTVGAQVVGELRDKAIIAMIVSLFAIVLYIRARFAEYSYGFAAVAALVHDVLITLGVLALCIKLDWLNAEISLPMVAAFLTIIGYSLNDTIVLFDRIRENRPRLKGSLSEILDISINQTLSRTLLTSVTTLLTVSLLFGFNYGSGSVLESFGFALIIGVLVGTYSSIFVASPVFLFLESRAQAKQAATEVEA